MHIVYLIKLNSSSFPNKYIGSKSNCFVKNSRIIDSRGKIYIGSSNDKTYRDLMKYCRDYEVQILASFDNYDSALLAERDIHLRLDVVSSPEYFNKSIATISNYSDPNYATYKHLISGKIARLPRTHQKVLNGEWVGVTKGFVLSEEDRKKRGRSGIENGFYNKKHSEETKNIIAKKTGDYHRGKEKSEEQRRKMAEARRLWWVAHKENNKSWEKESL